MALILYECPSDFSKNIPNVLAAEGISISGDGKRWAKIKYAKNEFAYTISDGVSQLSLSGGEDDDGFVSFFVFSPWNWKPKAVLKQREFHHRITTALLRAGAHVWHEKT